MARNYLYQAWAGAAGSAKRALIAQQLSAVYGLLGESDDSPDWLYRSYPEARNGIGEAVVSVIESFKDLPRRNVGVKGGPLARVPTGALAIVRDIADKPLFCVRPEPLVAGLTGLAETRLDLAALRLVRVDDMPEPWSVSAPMRDRMMRAASSLRKGLP